MTSRFVKVSEIAEKFRVSRDAVYLWIRQGKIPRNCVVRIAGTVRVDEEQFEHRLRAGELYQVRGRKRTGTDVRGDDIISPVAEDNFTTVRSGTRIEHAWTNDAGNIEPEHPFNPKMRTAVR